MTSRISHLPISKLDHPPTSMNLTWCEGEVGFTPCPCCLLTALQCVVSTGERDPQLGGSGQVKNRDLELYRKPASRSYLNSCKFPAPHWQLLVNLGPIVWPACNHLPLQVAHDPCDRGLGSPHASTCLFLAEHGRHMGTASPQRVPSPGKRARDRHAQTALSREHLSMWVEKRIPATFSAMATQHSVWCGVGGWSMLGCPEQRN